LLDRILRISNIGYYSDRYILITGCDSGFGHAAAKRLDSMGCHVFAGCLTENGVMELKKTCSDLLIPISLDITKPDSIRKALKVVTNRLDKDGKDLWGVLNNAGIAGPWGTPEWMSVDDYRRVSDVNLYGTIDVTMTFLPLVKRSRGRVVNTSSYAGIFSLPIGLPYSVSKYGLEAFSDGLRRSLRPYGCKVGIVEPGGHKTNIIAAESMKAAVTNAWNQATPEIKKEFGETYYRKVMDQMLNLDKYLNASLDPVVDAYVHALLGRYPRARYLCGLDALLIAKVAAMPEWFSDWVVGRL
jgi:retinol dehydrogenase-16